ncbi:hypothetical protein [Trinickia diaoshuihuensis]|uniref:hypothetical protein n=1 Tax=Trinickia diaoshuihuensis TaxID=2292265 RepID=UPI0013C31803|nr:hypothetical protein [Trinickia diaoshuihuensis]
MSDISGVRTSGANTPPELPIPSTTNQPSRPGSPVTGSSAQGRQSRTVASTAQFGNLSARAPTPESSTSQTRRTSLPLSASLPSSAPLIQASSSATVTDGTNRTDLPVQILPTTQLSDDENATVQRFAGDFRGFVGTSNPSSLEGHIARIQTSLDVASTALSSLAASEPVPGSQITIDEVAQYAHDPGVHAAEREYEDRQKTAVDLAVHAGAKKAEAEEARTSADKADGVVDAAKAILEDAKKGAGAARRAAIDADNKATTAEGHAEAKSKEAEAADGKATAVETQAADARKEADDAGRKADTAQAKATDKTREAEQQQAVADKAKGNAERLKDEADAAAAKASASRETAQQARQAINNAPAEQREAMRAPAQQAEHQASLDQAAAERAASKAKEAAEAAGKEQDSAASLHGEAQSLKKAAADARQHANGLHEKAEGLEQEAAKLRGKATELGNEAKNLKTTAQGLRGEAGKLGRAADEADKKVDKAKAGEQKAIATAKQAREQARTLEKEAEKAEADAEAARDQLKTAGAALGKAVQDAKDKAAEEAAKQKAKQKASATAEGDPSEQPEASASTTTNRPTGTGGTPDDEIRPVVETENEPVSTDAAAGNERAARPDSTHGPEETAEQVELRAKVANWALNGGKVAGQHLLSVGLATGLREVAGGLAEYLIENNHLSDEAKTFAASGIYASLMLAQAASMVYDERAGAATPLSRTGGAGVLGMLAGSLALGLATKSLKELVPSLVKTFVYSGGRDFVNTVLPLGTNPKVSANPAVVQMANTLLYGTNQAVINMWQTFGGESGAGYVSALRNNGTDAITGKPEAVLPGLGAVTSYVTANYMGEVANMFVETGLKSLLKKEPLPDFTLGAAAPTFKTLGKTMRDDGILRTAAFFGTYAGTNAINPSIPVSHIGERGAGFAESTIGSFYLMAFLLFCAMATAKKDPRRNETENFELPRRGPDMV